ncbi:hypothetical protein DY000_02030579 [Brassica cretica]|uniref:Zinc finger PMZ-type domain-containing protein n=1 Tax=Brassica cretica TaxID=69181 RepID=A0ABQ7DT30_BRACR|nr:hypothetical protein DY000_02030579 [Brassica cretica]
MVDLDRKTCSYGKYDLLKISCRHAIKAGLTAGRAPSSLTDDMYTASTWRTSYQESINPIGVPEDSWVVPDDVGNANMLPPKSRRGVGRIKKRRYETVEDTLRSSQGAQEKRGTEEVKYVIIGRAEQGSEVPQRRHEVAPKHLSERPSWSDPVKSLAILTP